MVVHYIYSTIESVNKQVMKGLVFAFTSWSYTTTEHIYKFMSLEKDLFFTSTILSSDLIIAY